MQQAMDSSSVTVINTIQNGVYYQIFKKANVSEEYDSPITSFQISTLEFFLKKEDTVLVPTISDRLSGSKGSTYVQIVAPYERHKDFTNLDILAWAECMHTKKNRHLIAVTALLEIELDFPFCQATTYGTLKEMLKG
jgi:hypothetical protein